MARKQKKLSRKEQARQRRAAVEQVRQERGWQPPSPAQVKAVSGDRELARDIQPLAPMLNADASSSDAMEEMLMMLLDTADLAREPEFEELLVHPFQATQTLEEVGQELGLDPAALGQLPEEEQAEHYQDIIELTTRRLLTEELRQDVIEALGKLRQRLRRSGDKQQLARAAALHSFLGQNKDDELWSMIGLTQAIVRRSVVAAFELLEASMEAAEESEVDTGDTAPGIRQKLIESGAAKKAEAILKKVPGLTRFLEKQSDRAWDEGLDALYSGDLDLDLFTGEEIEGGLEIFQEITSDLSAGEPATEPRVIPKEKAAEFVSRLVEYVTGLMTPERLAEVRARVAAAMKERAYNPWLVFLFMLERELAQDETVEGNIDILTRAFIGELRAATASEPAEDGEGVEE